MAAQARRELAGLEKAVAVMRDELVNNLAKLSTVNNHISKVKKHVAPEHQKLTETNGPEIQKPIQYRIRKLESALSDIRIERESRLEALSANRSPLLYQINRIHETIRPLLHEDTMMSDPSSHSFGNRESLLCPSSQQLGWQSQP